MTLLKESILLNSVAISLMNEGKHAESSQAMQLAIRKLELCFYAPSQYKGLYEAEKELPPIAKVESESAASEIYALIEERSPLYKSQSNQRTFTSVRINNSVIDVTDTLSEDNIFAFFDRMFHISHENASTLGLLKVYALMLFNQAVSQHVNATIFLSKNPDVNPDEYLSKVLWLYERVIEVARSSFHSLDVREMLCILVAASNNSGHISSKLMLFSETRQCIARVIHLLAVSDESSFTKKDLEVIFWSTCIFLEGRNLQNAPAA